MTADKNRQANGKFAKGNSAGGRKKGSRNKSTVTALELMGGQLEQVTKILIEKALEGDTIALRIFFDKLIANSKEQAVSFDMPEILSADDLPKATKAVLEALSQGNLTPTQAKLVSDVIGRHGEALELADLEKRLKALEQAQEEND